MGADDDEVRPLLPGHGGERHVGTSPVRIDARAEIRGFQQFGDPGLEIALEDRLHFR